MLGEDDFVIKYPLITSATKGSARIVSDWRRRSCRQSILRTPSGTASMSCLTSSVKHSAPHSTPALLALHDRVLIGLTSFSP